MVWVELHGGRRDKIDTALADALEKMGLCRRIEERPTYQTRDMRAVSEIDALRAEADKRGLKYHPRIGVAKLRALLAD